MTPPGKAPRTTVLVVEDDDETRSLLCDALASPAYSVVPAACGKAADGALCGGDIDVVVLDVGLPDISGVELCRRWRASGVTIPILMLTARSDVTSRVSGLEAGADDYVSKPFALAEVRARLRAVLRRGRRPLREQMFQRGAVVVDFARRHAWVCGREVPVTRREMEVLERLAEDAGHPVSREELLESLWGKTTAEAAASLEVIVARLRRKLEQPGTPSIIRTVRGLGYALASASPQ